MKKKSVLFLVMLSALCNSFDAQVPKKDTDVTSPAVKISVGSKGDDMILKPMIGNMR